MNSIIESSMVRVSKQHSCDWCNEKINRRENAHHSAVSFDGRISHFYVHPECQEAMNRDSTVDWYDDYPYEPHDQTRGKTITETEQMRMRPESREK